MAEDKNKQKPEELQDEQLDEVNGGTDDDGVVDSTDTTNIPLFRRV